MSEPVQVIGIDHVYLAVRDVAASERFYDAVLGALLGFRRNDFTLGGARHVQYYNRQLGIVLRPARAGTPPHDPGAPGLHHLCLRVAEPADVDRAAAALAAHGIDASRPRLYPEYAPDYYAIFLTDPDGVRLEITNFREERKAWMYRWDDERPRS
jgi:catechol 2,3-dioxygenase-like lactoylglutathione lyase family enzyme